MLYNIVFYAFAVFFIVNFATDLVNNIINLLIFILMRKKENATTVAQQSEVKQVELFASEVTSEAQEVKKEAKKETNKSAKVKKSGAGLKIVDYSEKAFAVIGDTKQIKAKLMILGGKFNPKLTCGAGWIFSKKRMQSVRLALAI